MGFFKNIMNEFKEEYKRMNEEKEMIKKTHTDKMNYIKECEVYAKNIKEEAYECLPELGYSDEFYERFTKDYYKLIVMYRRLEEIEFDMEYYNLITDDIYGIEKTKEIYMKKQEDENKRKKVRKQVLDTISFIGPYDDDSININIYRH